MLSQDPGPPLSKGAIVPDKKRSSCKRVECEGVKRRTRGTICRTDVRFSIDSVQFLSPREAGGGGFKAAGMDREGVSARRADHSHSASTRDTPRTTERIFQRQVANLRCRGRSLEATKLLFFPSSAPGRHSGGGGGTRGCPMKVERNPVDTCGATHFFEFYGGSPPFGCALCTSQCYGQ